MRQVPYYVEDVGGRVVRREGPIQFSGGKLRVSDDVELLCVDG